MWRVSSAAVRPLPRSTPNSLHIIITAATSVVCCCCVVFVSPPCSELLNPFTISKFSGCAQTAPGLQHNKLKRTPHQMWQHRPSFTKATAQHPYKQLEAKQCCAMFFFTSHILDLSREVHNSFNHLLQHPRPEVFHCTAASLLAATSIQSSCQTSSN